MGGVLETLSAPAGELEAEGKGGVTPGGGVLVALGTSSEDIAMGAVTDVKFLPGGELPFRAGPTAVEGEGTTSPFEYCVAIWVRILGAVVRFSAFDSELEGGGDVRVVLD
jgi:hypothetical protein